MKKLLSLIIIIIINCSIKAQDIMITKDGQKIEAKIEEVGIETIKYKKYNNQSGAAYLILKSDIASILFENGEVEVFSQEVQKPISPKAQKPISPKAQKPISPKAQKPISQEAQKLYSHLQQPFNKIGLDDKGMLAFFEVNNFPEYYNRFKAACGRSRTGEIILCTGTNLSALGFSFLMVGLIVKNYDYQVNWIIAGTTFMSFGQIIQIAGISITAKAGAKKREIKDTFAMEYFGEVRKYSYQPKLNLGITQNGGVGLTLKF